MVAIEINKPFAIMSLTHGGDAKKRMTVLKVSVTRDRLGASTFGRTIGPFRLADARRWFRLSPKIDA
jgi:hypothetical protein